MIVNRKHGVYKIYELFIKGVDDNGMVNINMVRWFFVRDVEGDA